MEHKLIFGGEQYLPFARSRIKALRATGLNYASQKFEFGDASVKVSISGEHEYIRIDGGTRDLLMVVNLWAVLSADNSSIYFSRVYRLDLKDPMDAKKASLIYSGSSKESLDGSVTIAPGFIRPYLTGAQLLDGLLITYSTLKTVTTEVHHYVDEYDFWTTTTTRTVTTVNYGSESAEIEENLVLDVELSAAYPSGRFNRTYSGLRIYSWAYFMHTSVEEGVTRNNIHIVAGPSSFSASSTTTYLPSVYDAAHPTEVNAAVAARVPYKWIPIQGGPEPKPVFVIESIPLPLETLPVRGTEYTPEEIGRRQKGYDFIRYNDRAIDRFGNSIFSSYPGNSVPGDLLSSSYYIGLADSGAKFQTKRIVDDAFYGSKMILGNLPGISSVPEYVAALNDTSTFGYTLWFDQTLPSSQWRRKDYPSPELNKTELNVIFATEVTHLTNLAKEWHPRVA